jgi:asparagine synthase (glutamine-hydrolysing)
MCGIAGIFCFDRSKASEHLLSEMLKAMVHRGPDDEARFLSDDGCFAFGMRRLAIIDLKKGLYPIFNEDHSLALVFNGEIYNYMELRKELEDKGHVFKTNTDAEAIVHAYEQYGVNCLQHFNGMFAIAIWDGNKKNLFLARDRLGIKPLYYWRDGKMFLFASEIKAILQHRGVPRKVNERAAFGFLVHGQCEFPEETFFEDILKVPAAHYMTVDATGGIQKTRYWHVNVNPEYRSNKPDAYYAEQFLKLFEDAVKKRLISDVPVGTCLSGGLDSSSIVCVTSKLLRERGVAKKVIGEKLKTFSACYKEKEVDESDYIDEVVKHTNAESYKVFPDAKRLWRELPKLVWHQEEPFNGPTVFAQWCVMSLAHGKVTVLLDGQGGDELLAGYLPYWLSYYKDLLRRGRLDLLFVEAMLSADLALPFIPYLVKKKLGNFPPAYEKLLNPEFVKNSSRSLIQIAKSGTLPQLLQDSLLVSSLPALLRYEDKNSMAFSIEARVPFLDYRLVELVASMPITQKLHRGWTKVVLRNAMQGILPEKIRKRRSKLGYAVPDTLWLKALASQIDKLFASKEFRSRPYYNSRAIREHFRKTIKHGITLEQARFFWRVVIFELWHRKFLPD